MECPRCGLTQEAGAEQCAGCGVFMARWRPRPQAAARPDEAGSADEPASRWRALRDRMFEIPPAEDKPLVVVRGVFLALMALWGARLIVLPLDSPELLGSFLHWIHLPFHEAGHMVFSPFGEFLAILGGTLGQLLVPLLVIATFLRQEQPYNAALGVWWLGASFMDCAPYINDARARVLMLISGNTGQEDWESHDWFQLLSRTGLLEQDHALARLSWLFGVLLVLAGLAWAGYVVWRQSRPVEPDALT